MSKTTPEEAKALARKQVQQRLMRLAREVDGLTWADRKCIGEAIAIIDEVRGLDAEPMAGRVDLPSAHEWLDASSWEGSQEWMSGWDAARNRLQTIQLHAHPAPSQPAAPVELPVVATTNWRQSPTLDWLRKVLTHNDESVSLESAEQIVNMIDHYAALATSPGLVSALQASMTALDDWLNIYAPEHCDAERVKEAWSRINERGTLAYIADLQERNAAAIAAGRKAS